MVRMRQHTIEYRGWKLTAYPGRTCVGCASQDRAPFGIFLLKGFSAPSVMKALRRRVDEIEDARAPGETDGGDRP